MPMWEHKAPNQSEFKVVHTGDPGQSQRYPAHFSVEVVGNTATKNTATKFSYLTLRNVRPEYAGKYKCSGRSVVLGKFFVHLNADFYVHDP